MVRTSLHALFITLACVANHAAHAQNKLPLQLKPAADVTARIEKQGESYVLMQPNGGRIVLVPAQDARHRGTPVFEEKDYDYDGHADITAGYRRANGDIGQTLYLYEPASKSYVRFDLSEETLIRHNCEGFTNLTRVVHRKLLRSECSNESGRQYDLVQIGADRSAWLVESSRMPEENLYWPYFGKPKRSISYDRRGQAVRETVLAEGEDAAWDVPSRRLALRTTPDARAEAVAQLARGDRVTMLGFQGETWMKISHQGTQGWVSLMEAYDLAALYDPQQPSTSPLTLWAMDYRTDRTDPDYYRNLLTLTLDNKSKEDIELNLGEVHLIFTGPDGARIAHRLYDVAPTILKAGASFTVDDNVIEQHGGRYVIYHPSETDPEYVPFFPEGLKPGRYRVRPVLTDPVGGVVYTKDEIEIDYPPHLRQDLVKP